MKLYLALLATTTIWIGTALAGDPTELTQDLHNLRGDLSDKPDAKKINSSGTFEDALAAHRREQDDARRLTFAEAVIDPVDPGHRRLMCGGEGQSCCSGNPKCSDGYKCKDQKCELDHKCDDSGDCSSNPGQNNCCKTNTGGQRTCSNASSCGDGGTCNYSAKCKCSADSNCPPKTCQTVKCKDGKCEYKDVDCGNGNRCNRNTGNCEPIPECDNNCDCPGPKICVDGKCVDPPCVCPPGTVCDGNECVDDGCAQLCTTSKQGVGGCPADKCCRRNDQNTGSACVQHQFCADKVFHHCIYDSETCCDDDDDCSGGKSCKDSVCTNDVCTVANQNTNCPPDTTCRDYSCKDNACIYDVKTDPVTGKIIVGCCVKDTDCELGKVCVANNVCEAPTGCDPLPYLPNQPDVGYMAPLALDFSASAFPNGPNIIMPFKLTNPSPYTDLDLQSTQEAIIFANDDCDPSGKIIAYTSGAQLPTGATFLPANGGLNALIPTIAVPDGVSPLNIVADLSEFTAPFWDPLTECDLGGEVCGYLRFCVEYQTFYCGEKMDLVDVNVIIQLDVQLECDTDECASDVKMIRDAVITDTGDDELGSTLQCDPCTDGQIEVRNGQSIEACLTSTLPGTCVLEIISFDFVMQPEGQDVDVAGGVLNADYKILPTDGANLPLIAPGVSCGPDKTECSIKFAGPNEQIEELIPGDPASYKFGFFRGVAIIGVGDDCDPSTRKLGHRQLEQTVDFQGAKFAATFKPAQGNDGCTGFFLFCLIQSIIAAILSLFGL